MRTISLINWKGGVGKTTVATNAAFALANFWGARVLLVDCDKQSNSTLFFDGQQDCTIADLLLDGKSARDCIQPTRYTPEWFIDRFRRSRRGVPFQSAKIDLIAANIRLMEVNLSVLRDQETRQDDILKTSLAKVQNEYDVCLIDNPPDINISVLNALVASDEVIIISTPDAYGVQGVHEMVRQIETEIRPFNRNIQFSGVLLNKFVSSTSGFAHLTELKSFLPVFGQRLRFTLDRLEESVRVRKSIYELSPRCGFAIDLGRFLESYLAVN